MNEDRQQPTNKNKQDDVGALLRLAGKRRPVSSERVRRVRAATHTRWQAELGRRSRMRRSWAAVVAVAAATLLLAFLFVGRDGVPLPTGSPARAESRIGQAWVIGERGDGPAKRSVLEVGDSIPSGSELITGETGRAAIRLASGHSVRLDRFTSLRLLDPATLALTRGAVYVDSGTATAGAAGISVQTPFGEVREVGTQFTGRVDDDFVRVSLREGRVFVLHGGRTHEVEQGSELELDTDGAPTRRAVATFGSGWDWMLEIAPIPDFEGRPARELLDWVARERGWTLGFADEATETATAQTKVWGSFDRLRIDQVLDAAMPTCGMTYRVEDGVLLVAAQP